MLPIRKFAKISMSAPLLITTAHSSVIISRAAMAVPAGKGKKQAKSKQSSQCGLKDVPRILY